MVNDKFSSNNYYVKSVLVKAYTGKGCIKQWKSQGSENATTGDESTGKRA